MTNEVAGWTKRWQNETWERKGLKKLYFANEVLFEKPHMLF